MTVIAIKGRITIRLKYNSQGRAPIIPNWESVSVATTRGARVHGPKKRVIIKPVRNAPTGDVTF